MSQGVNILQFSVDIFDKVFPLLLPRPSNKFAVTYLAAISRGIAGREEKRKWNVKVYIRGRGAKKKSTGSHFLRPGEERGTENATQ